jgi:hypothetical protein
MSQYFGEKASCIPPIAIPRTTQGLAKLECPAETSSMLIGIVSPFFSHGKVLIHTFERKPVDKSHEE